MGEESIKVVVRLPAETVKELEETVDNGRYDSISEAIADCVQQHLESHPEIKEKSAEKKVEVKMESLIREEVTMDQLIRDAAKKFTKEKIDRNH